MPPIIPQQLQQLRPQKPPTQAEIQQAKQRLPSQAQIPLTKAQIEERIKIITKEEGEKQLTSIQQRIKTLREREKALADKVRTSSGERAEGADEQLGEVQHLISALEDTKSLASTGKYEYSSLMGYAESKSAGRTQRRLLRKSEISRQKLREFKKPSPEKTTSYDPISQTYTTAGGVKYSMRSEDVPAGTPGKPSAQELFNLTPSPSQDFFLQKLNIKSTPTTTPAKMFIQKDTTGEVVDKFAISSLTTKTTNATQIKDQRIDKQKVSDIKKPYGILGSIQGWVETPFSFFGTQMQKTTEKGAGGKVEIVEGTQIDYTEEGEGILEASKREPINIFDFGSKMAGKFLTSPIFAVEKTLQLFKEPSAREQVFPGGKVQFEEIEDKEGKIIGTRPIQPFTPKERVVLLADIGFGYFTGYQMGKFGKGKVSEYQLKQLEKQKPEMFLGLQKTKEGKELLLVGAKKTTPKFKKETFTTFEVTKTGEKTFQIESGKGITKLSENRWFREPKITESEFTFFGGGGETTARVVKDTGFVKLGKDITTSTPVTGEIKILTIGKEPKAYKSLFGGLAKKEGDMFTKIIGGELGDVRAIKTGERVLMDIGKKESVTSAIYGKPTARIDFSQAGIIKKVDFGKGAGIVDYSTGITGGMGRQVLLKSGGVSETIGGLVGGVVSKVPITSTTATGTGLFSFAFLGEQLITPEVKEKKVVGLITKKKEDVILSEMGLGVGVSKMQKAMKTPTKQILFQPTATLQTQVPTQTVTPFQAQIQLQKMKTPTKQIPAPISSPSPMISLPGEVPGRLPLFGWGGKKPTMTKEQPYDAFELVHATDPKRRHYEKLNEKPLTLKSALSMMSRRVDTTISARGKIVKTDPIIQKTTKGKVLLTPQALDTKDNYYERNKAKFRQWKTKKKVPLPVGVMIERQKYRLDSPTEVKKIQKARKRLSIIPASQKKKIKRRTPFGF